MARRMFKGWRWVGRIILPLTAFAAGMGLLSLAVLNPLILALAQFLIALGGEPFAGNFDLVPFLSSIPGVLTAIVLAGSAIFLGAVQFGGLTLIAWSGRQGRAPNVWQNAFILARRLPQLLVLAAFGVAVGAMLLVPVGLGTLAAKRLWLSGGDIYFYVSTRPPEFYYALGLVGTVALVCAGLALAAALRWILAVPFCVIGGRTARDALRVSAESGKGRGGVLFVRLAAAGVFTLVLTGAATAALTFVFDRIFWPGQGLRTASLLLLAFALGATFIVALVSGAGRSLVAVICTAHYADIGGTEDMSRTQDARSGAPGWRVWAACLVLPFLALGQSAWTLEEFDMDEPVLVTAHRAGSHAAPENTLAALERAIAAGADFAEIDVQETRDGEVVVVHDTDFRRVAGLARNVWDLDLAGIQELDAGAWFGEEFRDERIPTLREFAERSRGRIRLNVELKENRHGQDLAARTLAILKETGVLEHAVLTSLDLGLLAQTRRLSPDVKIGYIASTGIGNMLALDIDFFSLAARIATPDFIRRARLRERQTHVWGVDSEMAVAGAVLDGAANVITDEPILARRTVDAIEDMTPPEVALLTLRRRLERSGLVRAAR